MKTVIRTEKLTKRFGDLTAVDGIDLDVHEGEVFGFLGPNGAGKTTTLRLLCALIAPTSGSAEIAGFRLGREDAKIRAAVGILTEQPGLYERQSAWDNLVFYATLYGLAPSVAKAQAERYLRLMGLWERRTEAVATFSRGMKQKMAIARAALHEPRVLFLDEPTAGIDPVARRELWNLLFELAAKGVTLMVTTHYMDEAERCGTVGYLYLSRMLVSGKPADLTRLPDVTPAGMRRVQVDCARGAAAVMGHARSLPYVDDVTIFGNSLHLLVRGEVADERIAADLRGAAGTQVGIRPIDAALEGLPGPWDALVNVAGVLLPEPKVLLAWRRYFPELLTCKLVIVKVVPVAPLTFWKVAPPSVLTCH